MNEAGGAAAPVKPWGYLATFAWGFGAFVAGEFVSLAALVLWRHGDIGSLVADPYDGAVVAFSVLVLDPVAVAILLIAIAIKGADPGEYLALTWPRFRHVTVGIIGIVVLIALTDALLFVSGRAIVSTFQIHAYVTAEAEGLWLPVLWIATVIVAPAGEEILFRGFLFRGFVRSKRYAWPAIVVISLLWAFPHAQYDWTGLTEIFFAGLFLGWVRWRSGSTLLTFLLHGLFNLEGMVETFVQVKHLL